MTKSPTAKHNDCNDDCNDNDCADNDDEGDATDNTGAEPGAAPPTVDKSTPRTDNFRPNAAPSKPRSSNTCAAQVRDRWVDDHAATGAARL